MAFNPKKLKIRRIELDFTPKSLAKELDIEPATVRSWERGDSCPHLTILAKVAMILEVREGYFFD